MFNFQLIRSVFVFALTNALAAGLPLLLLPLLTRVLSPEDYGLVAMYSVVLSALGAFTGLSVHGAVGMRYFDRAEIDFPQYVGACLAILVVTTSAVLLLVWIAQTPLETLTSLPAEWLVIAVLTSGLQFILLIRLSIFQSAKKANMFGLFRVSQTVLDAVLSVALVLFLSLAWEGRLIGMSAAIVVLGVVSLISLAHGGWINLAVRGEHVRNALKFGVPLVPHVVGGMLIAMADRFMITNLLGVGSTGVYMVAVQIGLGVYLLADACSRAISPWVIEVIKEQNARKNILIARYYYIYFTFILFVAFFLGGTAPYFLSFLVGNAFQGAAPLIMTIAIGQAFGGMYLVVANVIFYKNKTLQLAAITISCGMLNALLSYFLLPVEGIQGAAHAYLAAQLVMFVATFALSQKLYPLPWFVALGRLKRGGWIA